MRCYKFEIGKIIFYLLIGLMTINCHHPVQSDIKIYGHWIIDTVEYVEMKKYAPEELNKGVYFNFEENGGFKGYNKIYSSTYVGTWKMLNDSIIINTKSEKLSFKIEKYYQNSLILKSVTDDSTTLRFYLKKNN